MAEFAEKCETLNEEDPEKLTDTELVVEDDEIISMNRKVREMTLIMEAISVVYCPVCSMPPEYCEYGTSFQECLPWIVENYPECLSASVKASLAGNSDEVEGEQGEDKKKKKRGGGVGPKKKPAAAEIKVIVSRVQRQKKKFVTVVAGLDTVPDLKIKDVAKAFGRKFSSGSSVSENATGGKEVVIQGDVSFELPQILINEFKVPETALYIQDDAGGAARPYV